MSAAKGWLLGVGAGGLVVWLTLGGVGFDAKGVVTAPDRPDQAPGSPAPPAPSGRVVVIDAQVADARWADEDLTPERAARVGLLGLEEQWVRAVMEGREGWERVADKGGPTYKDAHLGTLVTFKIEGGRVTRIRADFRGDALSAHATALAPLVVGNRDPLTMHLEEIRPEGSLLRAGVEEVWDGRRVHWRAQLQAHSEGLYGPAWLELSQRPFSGAP